MFYTKEKINTMEIIIELNDENVFCTCPDCGAEVAVPPTAQAMKETRFIRIRE